LNIRVIAVTVFAVAALLVTAGITVLTIYMRPSHCAAVTHKQTDSSVTGTSAYFAGDYQSARRRFLSASERAGAQVEQIRHPVRGPHGDSLYTDIALVGNPQSEQFLVLISGTHGVEGFAGSALQVGLLEEGIQNQLPPETAVLMIHAINPYGMAYLRRFNEDNIDLNRNFRNHAKPPPDNPSYRELASAIAPESISPGAELVSWVRLLWFRIIAGQANAKAAISGGQYTHPDGLFYGGRSETWSNKTLRRIVDRYLQDTQEVVAIDIHTALGRFGAAGLLPNIDQEKTEYHRAFAIWGPSLVIESTQGEPAHVHLQATVKRAMVRMLPETRVTAVTLEFGTFPSIDVFRALRAENWLHHHDSGSHPRAQEIKTCLLQTYSPESEKWKSLVWSGGGQVVGLALSYLGNLATDQEGHTSFNTAAPPGARSQEVF
jgi:succinylglutamate desuccinylase